MWAPEEIRGMALPSVRLYKPAFEIMRLSYAGAPESLQPSGCATTRTIYQRAGTFHSPY